MLGLGKQNKVAKDERDRFVGFAFAAADTLIELDRDRRIREVMGVAPNGKTQDLIGREFVGLLRDSDQAVVAAALVAAARGDRIRPTRIAFADGNGPGTTLTLSGWCLPDLAGRYFLALRDDSGPVAEPDQASDSETGLLGAESFNAAAASIAQAPGSGTMTLLDVEGLNDVRRRLTKEASTSLMRRIGSFLRGHSVSDALAARTSEETFGLVHDPGVDVRGLVATLRDIVAGADPSGQGIAVRDASVALDGEAITKDEAAKAVFYAIRRFGESRGTDVSLGSLSECCSSMVSESVDRLARLKHIIATDDFTIAAQAVVELSSRQPYYHEAVVDFGQAASEGGRLEDFAAQVGMVDELDARVVAKTVEALADLRTRGGKESSVAVNLSMASIERTAFIDGLERILRDKQNLRPKLWFEIGGTAGAANVAVVNRSIQALRRAGHRVCLDDFGVGSGAFDHLRGIEVDAVKIGGATVAKALTEPRARAFLKAMTGFCHDMGVEVIGNDVGDDRTAEFLAACGVRFGQGAMLGVPRPLKSLVGRVKRGPASLIAQTRRVLSPT
jgi:EAL domain-containing protein (putative c-di-GMP-specific phosphodiesterase class I)